MFLNLLIFRFVSIDGLNLDTRLPFIADRLSFLSTGVVWHKLRSVIVGRVKRFFGTGEISVERRIHLLSFSFVASQAMVRARMIVRGVD